MKKIFILLILLLSGCSDYKELNNLAIVNTIGIDKKDNNYKLCIEVLNTDKENGKNKIYYSTGKTINEAINKVNNKSTKIIYGGHLDKIIVSKDILNDKKIDLVDSFFRLTEVKDEFDFFVTKDNDACDIVKSLSKLPNNSSSRLQKNSKENRSTSSYTNIDVFISNYLKTGIDPVISVLNIKDNEVYIDNIAITKNGKVIKYLDTKESIGYNLIRNEIDKISIPISYKDKYSTIKINKSTTKNKVIKKNNKYIIEININIEAYLTEYNFDLDLTKNNTITKLEKISKKEIDKYITSAIKLDKVSNYLGFKRMIYERYPKEKDYIYSIKKNIKVNIKRKGEIKNYIKEKK
ncbi:MAG: Ger(x)C family spore germination protein [Bacilli bacterium]|nr:Ger(x)C family spore germination protein [Bacilli bacterium]